MAHRSSKAESHYSQHLNSTLGAYAELWGRKEKASSGPFRSQTSIQTAPLSCGKADRFQIRDKMSSFTFLIHCEFNTISSKACKTSVLKTTPWMQPFGPMLSLLPGKANSWVAIRNLPGNAKAGLVCSLPGSSKSRENAREPLLHTPEAPPITISPHWLLLGYPCELQTSTRKCVWRYCVLYYKKLFVSRCLFCVIFSFPLVSFAFHSFKVE